MPPRVLFIERRDADTNSIERVFRQVAISLDRLGVPSTFQKLPYGNSFLGLIGNLFRFRGKDGDIHHITGHVHYMAIPRRGVPVVLTVHDLGILRHRRGIRRWLIKKLYFDLPVMRASAVTVISRATKRELLDVTNVDEQKVFLVHDPVIDDLRVDSAPAFRAEKPRLLQVGTAPHKNLDGVLDAVAGLRCELTVIGGLSAQQKAKLERSGIDHVLIESLDDVGIREQYRRSDILLFCSTFEGFGLPIIEAQAMRVAVITSNLEPMSEVAGDGALTVDPFDAAAIRKALEEIIGNETLRMDLIARGLENVKRFRGERVAESYYEVYRQLLPEDSSAQVTHQVSEIDSSSNAQEKLR